MAKKTRWANILCHEDMSPYKLIVTDGKYTSEIPISNTKIDNVKRWAYQIYDVQHKQILVSQVFDNDSPAKE